MILHLDKKDLSWEDHLLEVFVETELNFYSSFKIYKRKIKSVRSEIQDRPWPFVV